MIFVVDVGNTNVALAGVEGCSVRFRAKVETNAAWSAETYLEKIRPLAGDVSALHGCILSSVVPAVTEALIPCLTALLGVPPKLVTPELNSGLTMDVEEPAKVGRDRIVDAAFAAEHYPLPLVTVDLGTASTFNLVLPGKIFAGGIICAGIQTGLRALAANAAQLPSLELTEAPKTVGKNTRECMLSGAVLGTAAMVDGLVARMEAELGSPVTLVLTGGGGYYVSPHLQHKHFFDPDLILKGLAMLYERN